MVYAAALLRAVTRNMQRNSAGPPQNGHSSHGLQSSGWLGAATLSNFGVGEIAVYTMEYIQRRYCTHKNRHMPQPCAVPLDQIRSFVGPFEGVDKMAEVSWQLEAS
jgi:hypothetical protein